MNIDDPNLTAFALGELEEGERTKVAERLQHDEAAAAEVKQVRDFTSKLRATLRTEPAPELTAARREELLTTLAEQAGAESGVVPFPERRSPWRVWLPASLAAALAIGGGYVAYEHGHAQQGKGMQATTVAKNEAPGADAKPGNPAPVAAPQPQLAAAKEAAPASKAKTEPAALAVKTDDLKGGRRSLTQARYVRPAPRTPLNRASKLSESFITQRKPVPPQIPQTFGNTDLLATTQPSQNEFQRSPATPASAAAPMPVSADSPATAAAGAFQTGTAEVRRAKPAATPSAGRVSRYSGSTTISGSALTLRGFAGGSGSFHGGGVGGPPMRTRASKAGGMAAASTRIASNTPGEAGTSSSFPMPSPAAESPVVMRGQIQPSTALPKDGDSTLILTQTEPGNTEAYDAITDNPFLTAKENPLSTFSLDVDTASYANVRRFLQQHALPPKGAVRIEELVNYFGYNYAQPKEGEPFSVNMEVAGCPWAPEHRLLRVGLKTHDLTKDQRPTANLVFLIDVSGSMDEPNKLPLVKESLHLLIEQLQEKDTVAIAVYAGNSGVVCQPTSDKAKMYAALDRLEAGGSTNGAAGIRQAYDLARRSFGKEKVNRVILCTDGDFNVGVTSQSALLDLIQTEAKSHVFLTVLGFGYGNLKDSTMEKLADKGNGNYAYIDSLKEGRRVLVQQMAGTLVTVAKDVKIQVEFNPAQVGSYRLVGYENRLLAKEDFNDDKKDAGEVGAGQTVTVLYELVEAKQAQPETSKVDQLKYQPKPATPPQTVIATPARDASAPSSELLTLKLRWKAPDADTSKLSEFPLVDRGESYEKSSKDFRFAASVASFGMLLRDSPYKGSANWGSTRELAVEGRGEDPTGERAEFIGLIDAAKGIAR